MKKNILLILFLATAACSQGSKLTGSGSTLPASSGSGSGGSPIGPEPENSHVQLSWTSNPGEQQGFKIFMSTDNVNFTQNQIVPDGTNSASVTGLPSGTYYFQILGYNQAGSSPVSPTLTAVVP